EGALRLGRGEAPELVERLAHPSGFEVGFANLVEMEEGRLLLERLRHARAQLRELLGAVAPLAGVEAQDRRDGAVRGAAVLLREARGPEPPGLVLALDARREAGRRHDAVAQLVDHRLGEDVVGLAPGAPSVHSLPLLPLFV